MPDYSVVKIAHWQIEAHYLNFIEAELRRHPHRQRRLATLEDDIIHATKPGADLGMPRNPGPGNPTLGRAIALVENEERRHLSLQVRLIRETFAELIPDLQAAVHMVYFDGRYTLEGAAEKLGIDRKTLRKRCNQALLAFVISVIGDWAVTTSPNSPRHGDPDGV